MPPKARPTVVQPMIPGLVAYDLGPGAVRGKVIEILSSDLSKDWYLLRIETDGGEQHVISGRGDPIVGSDEVEAEGQWLVNPRFGRQLDCRHIKVEIPETASAIVKYLSRGTVLGVGTTIASRLESRFGEALPDHIRDENKLVEAGVPTQKAQAIASHMRARTRRGKIDGLLDSHGIGPTLAAKIQERYGDRALHIVTREPYRLAKDIHGIGFKKADRLALSQGLQIGDPARLRAGVLHVLADRSASHGDCAFPRQALVTKTADVLALDGRLIESAIDLAIEAGELTDDIAGGRRAIFDIRTYQCELDIAEMVAARVRQIDRNGDLDNLIERGRLIARVPLDEGQRQVVRMALTSGFSILTGGPGTGKTSTIRTIVACLGLIDPMIRIGLVAPTGRAAQRMSEATGHSASTIHRFLIWDPAKNKFVHDLGTPVGIDFLIVDESSMLDIWLVRDLFRALPPDTPILLAGDRDQLPSVGAGNVLADMIDSGRIPYVRLIKIHRTGEGSLIARACAQINDGEMPTLFQPGSTPEMWGAYTKNHTDVPHALTRILQQVAARGFNPMNDVQVVTPGHEHGTGTRAINQLLQKCLNSDARKSIQFGQHHYRLGDRVVHNDNDTDRHVFNGDIGRIIDIQDSVSRKGSRLIVEYGEREISYTGREIDDLGLAYAISIHRSQGSEFPVGVVLATHQHHISLKRNLLFTGTSRARLLGCVIGQQSAVRTAVNTSGANRLTGLAQRLAKLIPADRQWQMPAA